MALSKLIVPKATLVPKFLLPFLLILCLQSSPSLAGCKGVGKFVNPITDICWGCLLPITIGSIEVFPSSDRQDTSNPSLPVCTCPRGGVPVPGISVGFWEPVRLADVTRIPFCMVNLGGISLMETTEKHGVVARKNNNEAMRNSFYHVHWYIYPVVYWLEILVDFLCLEQSSIDIAYLSEFDPLWSNDRLNLIINPEALLFGNPIAQMACAADCGMATASFPSDSLFWCAGCDGGLYPFGGFIEHHVGGVQASSLIVERLIARLHRAGLAWKTSGKEALCQKQLALVVPKTQYKLQMTYPIPNTAGREACNSFGHSSAIWGSGREIPAKGEDFGYLIWRKRNCCLV